MTKTCDIVAHVWLAVLLGGDEWGVIGLAMAVRVFTDVLRRTGLRQVLVQRHLKFNRWATPGFWMALAIGLAATVIMAAAAPVVARIYKEPELTALILILALVPPVGALGTVPLAKLQSDLRFRALAISDSACRIAQVALRVLLVLLLRDSGLGPLGYILPEPLAEIGRTSAYWWMARPKIRLAAQWRRWKFLLADSGWMFIATNANKLVEQADKLILGLFHATDVVGAYYWAYMISRQTIDVFVWNLEKILLPALSHLQLEPRRQVEAFLRAARLLAVLVVPACLMLAAVIDPVLHILLPKGQRDDSIPVIQVMSAAMSMWVIYGPTASLIKAQGRFKLFMVITWLYAIFFVAVITFAAWLGRLIEFNGAIAVAFAVGACMLIFGPIQAYIGIRPGGGTWRDVAGIYLPPIFFGLIAIGIPTWLSNALPMVRESNVGRMVVIALIGGGLYLGSLRMFMPSTWRALLEQAHHLVPSLKILQNMVGTREQQS
ncbi:MAG: oligosaccharide flippase family protein [Phycisphaerales bacterium]|nr:MAG: oligosaccharide flippase family protein [Phycisphaerales bacterium]